MEKLELKTMTQEEETAVTEAIVRSYQDSIRHSRNKLEVFYGKFAQEYPENKISDGIDLLCQIKKETGKDPFEVAKTIRRALGQNFNFHKMKGDQIIPIEKDNIVIAYNFAKRNFPAKEVEKMLLMEKVSENVKVLCNDFYGRVRPFEILGTKVSNSPMYPLNISGIKPTFVGERKKLFLNATKDEILLGVFIGDVYQIPEKDFYLFCIRSSVPKEIKIGRIANHNRIDLEVVSENKFINNISVLRENRTSEKFLEEVKSKIEKITTSDRNIVDKATSEVEKALSNRNQTHLI